MVAILRLSLGPITAMKSYAVAEFVVKSLDFVVTVPQRTDAVVRIHGPITAMKSFSVAEFIVKDHQILP